MEISLKRGNGNYVLVILQMQALQRRFAYAARLKMQRNSASVPFCMRNGGIE